MNLFLLNHMRGSIMKIPVLIIKVLLLFVAHDSLFAHYIPKHYARIECKLKPMKRNSSKRIRSGSSRNLSKRPSIPNISTQTLMTRKNTTQEFSRNWCGYVGVSSSSIKKNSVSAVYGSWVVPSLKYSKNNRYSSIWVGIDGFTSKTVEQIGTGHDFINGKAYHYAWFAMYPRRGYYIYHFPVHPGDIISARVEYVGNDVFILSIINNTREVYTTIPTRHTKLANTQRSSANWIVDALYSTHILPLSHFTRIGFFDCSAIVNGIHGPINNISWQNISLKMVKRDKTVKAKPSDILSDPGAFFVDWHHQ